MRSFFSIPIVACALAIGGWVYLQTQPDTSLPHAGPSAARNTAETAPTAVSIGSLSASGGASDALLVGAAGAPMSPSAVESDGETQLATAMHAFEQSNPARALDMARQGQKRWPTGARAAEFARTEVKCLYMLGRRSEARGAAEAMVNKYVGSAWALEVERETGAHPYVNH